MFLLIYIVGCFITLYASTNAQTEEHWYWIYWLKRHGVSEDGIRIMAREEQEQHERFRRSLGIVDGMNIEAKEKKVKSKYIYKLLKESSYLMQLSNIKKKFYWMQSIFQQTECMICLKEFDARSKCRILSCFHFFHDNCIQKWFLKGNFSCPHCKTNYNKLRKGQFNKAHFKQKLKYSPELDIRSTYSNQIRAAKKYKVTQADLNKINNPKSCRGRRSSSLDTALTKKYERDEAKKLTWDLCMPFNDYADSKTRAIIKLPGKLTTDKELEKSSLYLDQTEFMSKLSYNILKKEFRYFLNEAFIKRRNQEKSKRTIIREFKDENLYEEEKESSEEEE